MPEGLEESANRVCVNQKAMTTTPPEAEVDQPARYQSGPGMITLILLLFGCALHILAYKSIQPLIAAPLF